jgi:hypothetical protein
MISASPEENLSFTGNTNNLDKKLYFFQGSLCIFK